MDASKMTFEEWLAAKKEEDKRITHGAETVKDDSLYELEMAINKVCFDGKLRLMNLYYIPPALDRGSNGLYGYSRIMVSKPFFDEHGIDEFTISTMFHELCHAWDDLKGIKDTNGDYHNEAFRQTCKNHGGIARFTNSEDGFNDARPTAETLQLIRAELS